MTLHSCVATGTRYSTFPPSVKLPDLILEPRKPGKRDVLISLQLVMDAAAGAVSAIDPFSSWLPLPFRVAILLVLGTDVLEQSFVLN